jgi:PLP dependent protein
LLKEIQQKIGAATLVAVSKYQADAAVLELYNEGQRIFAESKAQDLEQRAKTFPNDIEWHFIGHLQTNKIKQVLPYASLIHSVDSEKLLYAIDNYFENKPDFLKNIDKIDVLLQLKIAQEDSKFGFTAADLEVLLQKINTQPLAGVRIVGLMGMATNTEDTAAIRSEFRLLQTIFKDLQTRFFSDKPYFATLSMGMSSDFEIAIGEGATMVRIGSLLFN